MSELVTKFFRIIFWSATIFLLVFQSWILADLKIRPLWIISVISLFLIFAAIFTSGVEIRKARKQSRGFAHVLEKSEEIRANSEKLKNKILLMVDDLPEGILIIDKDDNISLINNKAENFLGVAKKEVLNKPVLELGNLSNMKKIVFPLLVNFKAEHQEDIELKKNFILNLTVKHLSLSKNNTAKMIILQDVTKIKMAEKSKNHFILTLVHQLKAPAAAVQLSLKMLLNYDFGKLNKGQKDILEKTCKKNESLIYLVEELLEEARSEEAGYSEHKSLVNLQELANQVADFYKDEMKSKKISFKFVKPKKKLPEVSADPEKIKMVIQNLFDNAVKYTKTGGKIEVGIATLRDKVEFKIKDSGIGIPEIQKKKIFSRFSRGPNVAKLRTAGSGLGLSIAKDIIDKHNGKIWFESKENKGSVFFFSLPYSDNL